MHTSLMLVTLMAGAPVTSPSTRPIYYVNGPVSYTQVRYVHTRAPVYVPVAATSTPRSVPVVRQYAAPTYSRSSYSPPVYRVPVSTPVTYSQPVNVQPAYSQPAYSQPTYSTPVSNSSSNSSVPVSSASSTSAYTATSVRTC